MTTELTPERAALQRAADILGGQAALASVLGYGDRRNVAPYFSGGRRFPAEHCPAIERATKLRAADDPTVEPVMCEELRPDVPWEVLRQQVASEEQRGA